MVSKDSSDGGYSPKYHTETVRRILAKHLMYSRFPSKSSTELPKYEEILDRRNPREIDAALTELFSLAGLTEREAFAYSLLVGFIDGKEYDPKKDITRMLSDEGHVVNISRGPDPMDIFKHASRKIDQYWRSQFSLEHFTLRGEIP